MKKLLRLAAIGSIALAAQTAQAMTWEVLCVKQGPVRECPSKPLRELDPSAGNPGNTPGYPIGARSIPSKAANAEQSDVPGTMNFFSLGFGGQIILRSSAWIGNGPGADVSVFETTWGNPSCKPDVSESALVEFSQDGIHWVTPGPVMMGAAGAYNSCHNGSYDISPLLMAQYVRITDRTNPSRRVRGDGNDAFDVDGVVANYEMPSTPETPGTPNPVCDYLQGVASQYVGAAGNFPGRGIVDMRKNFANANINEPAFPVEAFTNPSVRDAVSEVYNFWSLGFGGYACFQLPYTVFDGPGAEIFSFETTWQNQPCPNYPEKADVRVSADGITWSEPVRICKDALGIPGSDNAIDLASFPGFPAINFIRYQDATDPADFGAGADGYDIDNIYIAQMPPNNPGTPDGGFSCWADSSVAARRAIPAGNSQFIDGGVPEEMMALEFTGASLVDEVLSFRATIAERGEYAYSIRNANGQEMLQGVLEGALYETPEVGLSVSKLPAGVYFLTLRSPNSHESLRFVKK